MRQGEPGLLTQVVPVNKKTPTQVSVALKYQFKGTISLSCYPGAEKFATRSS
jgi:hypothetical protein